MSAGQGAPSADVGRLARHQLNHFEQMHDAQSQCVPCKLCGGKAVISDAGEGAGYYVACSNSHSFKEAKGCLLSMRRLGGWAYNVMDWWNRLHSQPASTRQVIAAAYEAGATDSHNDWLNGSGERGARISEAALDYADAVLRVPT